MHYLGHRPLDRLLRPCHRYSGVDCCSAAWRLLPFQHLPVLGPRSFCLLPRFLASFEYIQTVPFLPTVGLAVRYLPRFQYHYLGHPGIQKVVTKLKNNLEKSASLICTSLRCQDLWMSPLSRNGFGGSRYGGGRGGSLSSAPVGFWFGCALFSPLLLLSPCPEP